MFILITVGNHSLSSSEDAFITKGWQSTKLLLLLAFLFGDIIQLYTGHTPYRVYSDTLYRVYSDTLYRVCSDILYRVYSDTLYRVYSDTLYRVYTIQGIHIYRAYKAYTIQGIHYTGYTLYRVSNDESIVFCGSHVFYLSFFFKWI